MRSKIQEININACKIMSVSRTLEHLVCKTTVIISILIGTLIKASQIHSLHKLLTEVNRNTSAAAITHPGGCITI